MVCQAFQILTLWRSLEGGKYAFRLRDESNLKMYTFFKNSPITNKSQAHHTYKMGFIEQPGQKFLQEKQNLRRRIK